MPFQESADSLKSKLQLNKASRIVLVGVVILVLLLLGVASFFLLGGLDGDTFSFETSFSTEAQGEAESSEGGEASSDEGEEEVATLFVHVSGAVNAPGVYELAEGSRVYDALAAAGGANEEAASDALNLARLLQDGEQLVVPTQAEAQAAEQSGETGTSASSASSSYNSSGLLNINLASAEELDTLPGIGPATAEKIIADREANGSFSSIEDIKRVSGIGDKKYEQLKDLICVS